MVYNLNILIIISYESNLLCYGAYSKKFGKVNNMPHMLLFQKSLF